MCRLLRRFFTSLQIKTLFLASLIFVLQLGHPFQIFSDITPAVAQDNNSTQLIQTGVESYQEGNYRAAILSWESAEQNLESIPLKEITEKLVTEKALVFENLARANLQIGKQHKSIEYWQKATAAYRQVNNNTQVGRMLTEQAQTLINLGQHRQAITLLCAPPSKTSASSRSPNCTVNSSLEISKKENDLEGQAAAYGSLAEAYRLQGQFKDAQNHAEQVLKLNLDQYESQALNVQGKIHSQQAQIENRRAKASESLNQDETKFREQEEIETSEAIKKFIASAEKHSDLESELVANLNLLTIYIRQKDVQSISTIQERLKQLIRDQLPDSRLRAYTAIALAKSYQPTSRDFDCRFYQTSTEGQEIALQQFEVARNIAIRIDDGRTMSFALGELGHIHECQQDWDTATTLTEQAQRAAGPDIESADSLYLWEWQMGRIRKKQSQDKKQSQEKRVEALGLYEQAITTLDKVRTDILTADRDLQFDFRDSSVEPLYREYIELQLDLFPLESDTKRTVVPISKDPQQNATLKNSLETLDSLRLAELQNFFGDDCILETSNDVSKRLLSNESKTVVISSIDFPDQNQTALIASFPNGESILTRIPYQMEIMETGEGLKEAINDYVNKLNEFWKPVSFDTQSAKALYDILLGPFQGKLKDQGIDTLVLVHDHLLRGVPMAALYTGSEYLAQQYAIATTPSLSLTIETAPRSASPKMLVMGLTKETKIGDQTFGGLPFVEKEIKSIEKIFKSNKPTVLRDNEFTLKNLKDNLNGSNFSILHFATHGQFSPSPEDSFLVIGIKDKENQKNIQPIVDGSEQKLTFDKVEDVLRESSLDSKSPEPIDLITLSACQTASGDDRSTLGLAGIAIRSGARSALASINILEDNAASKLIENFYSKYLQDTKISKAQVLQEVQKNAITGDDGKVKPIHPGIWSQLVLVGNWQ